MLLAHWLNTMVSVSYSNHQLFIKELLTQSSVLECFNMKVAVDLHLQS